MKRILLLFLVLFVIFMYGCKAEDSKSNDARITTWSYKVDNIEVPEEAIEEEGVTTVKLCHDTDNGIVRWVNGSVFGFYNNASRFAFRDKCLDNNLLIEYYCEDEIPQYRPFTCRNGCIDNHCA